MPGWLQTLKTSYQYVAPVVNSTAKIAQGLAQGMVGQVATIPRVGNLIYTKPEVREFISHMSYMVYADLLPFVLLTAMKDITDYINSDDENSFNSTYLFPYALTCLGALITTYKFTKVTSKTILHTQVMMIEGVKLANKNQLQRLECGKECDLPRYLKGMFRQGTNYWASVLFIECVGFIPIVGGGLSASLYVYHRGQCAAMLAMPLICERHLLITLQNNPGLALSLGLSQELFSQLVIKSLESFGIPAYYFESMLRQVSMLATLFLASNMVLPHRDTEITQNYHDPLLYLQKWCGHAFDKAVMIGKVVAPLFLGKPEQSIDWQWWLASVKQISSYRPVQLGAKWALPPELINFDSFSKHPIIKKNWKELCVVGVGGVEQLLELKKNPAIVLATKSPKTAAIFYSWVMGGSKTVTEEFLKAISNPEIINYLNELLQFLQSQIIEEHNTQDLGKPSSVILDTQRPTTQPEAEAMTESQAIQNSSNLEATQVVRLSEQSSLYQRAPKLKSPELNILRGTMPN